MRTQQRLTLLAPHFRPETNAAGRRLTAAAEHFRDAGWQVTVITPAPHHPENVVHAGYDGAWRRATTEDGMRVIRYQPFLVPRTNLPLRLLSELLFAVKAGAEALFSKSDVVLASSPYMFLGPAALTVARLARARFAWDVRDLTWKYVGATGRRSFGMDHLLSKLMAFTARHADVLTTTSARQLEELPGGRNTRSAVITNGLTEEFMRSLRAGKPTWVDGRFTVLYAGLLGFPQGLGTLVDAAALLPHIRFVIAGGGPEEEQLRARAAELPAANVELLGHVDVERLRDLYASADVLVALLRGGDGFRATQPSKVWEYMATGKPVIFAGDNEATQIMLEHQLGSVVAPEDASALAAEVQRLVVDESERSRLGQNGYRFVLAHRNRATILERWNRLLDDAT